MKVVLTQPLHARPASLLVRLAIRQAAEVEIRKGSRKANARSIIEVLELGGATGEEIEIEARGDDAESALKAIVELVSGGFSADLVPETGTAMVEGVAVGRAVVTTAEAHAPREPRNADQVSRARAAVAAADEELAQLVAALPQNEAALFDPERAILRDAASRIEAEVAKGTFAEDAVRAVLGGATTDLIADARARLLDALTGSAGSAMEKVRNARPGDLVLVTDRLTPSLVVSLPARVRAIVAIDDARESAAQTSHATILARGRGVPLALVPSHVASSIADGDEIMVDTTASPARVWIEPSALLVREGQARKEAMARRSDVDDRVAGELASRLGVDLYVNVNTLQERVPAGARGVGLLRTELLFAARSAAPSEDEQYASLIAVARCAPGKMVTARLFDAGGDKPLPWLAPSGDERGIGLLFAHPDILAAQIRAIGRAAKSEAIRVLLPLCRSAADVRSIRALAAPLHLSVGAMIETPEAARDAAAIAAEADFVCIGTNDLAGYVLGAGRAETTNALDPRVLAAVDEVIRAAHALGRRVTICGEIAADRRGSRVAIGLGADALSVATARFADLVRSLSTATREECQSTAQAALSGTP